MNILFIAHDSLSGGSGRCLYELICLLKEHGNVNPIVLTHKTNSLSKILKEKGIETYSFRYGFTCSWTKNKFISFIKKYFYRSIFNRLAYYKLQRKIDFHSIDLIYSNSSVIDFGSFLYRRTKIPHVWHLREFYDFVKTTNVIQNRLPDYILNNSLSIFCVSKAVQKNWFPNKGDNEKIKIIYDGVVAHQYQNINKNIDVKLKIVFCGRLCNFKGQFWAIQALCKIPKEVLQYISLDFYGSGDSSYEAFLKKEVDNHGLQNIVHFHGFEPNLEIKLLDYQIGLNLSKAEGFGRTTVEYMLAGLYVIAFNTGATPEVLAGGKYGFLIEYGNVDILSKKIVSVFNNWEHCNDIAQKAQLFAKKKFDISHNYQNILNVFREIKNG